ncbi:tetratricopeptide repeat protein [Mangrovimonas sp. YM274]|uniref:tetratricopeptide repeat protein n=1 Tax=Mangrovimonas sp. YM274 TaxID=3070660 RepID=UPI0027DD0634|nr:tetratricopeptide repeat protein [Mangrovimonas sp. YM274]WMI69144.1 tetratricopeptide repeat protein [Mangrovimonas sp. YM274]
MKLAKVTALIIILFYFLNEAVYAQEMVLQNHNIDAVFQNFKSELRKASALHNEEGITRGHIKMADFYGSLRITNEALKHYQEALHFQTKQDTSTIYASNKIAELYLSLKKYEAAKKYLNESLKLSDALKFDKGKATALGLMGSVAEKESKYETALECQESSLKLFESLKDSTGLAVTYENIGSIYEDLEDYDKAYRYFAGARAFSIHSPMHVRLNIINNMGDVKRKNGEFEKGLTYTKLALEEAKIAGNTHQQESALKDLAKVYSALGDFQLAYQFMEEHAHLNEQEIERKNGEQVGALQVLYEVKEKEAQLALLHQQNEIQSIRQRILAFASVLALLTLSGWFIYFKKKKQQEAKIGAYKQQILQADLDRKTAEEAALQREIEFKLTALTNYSLHLANKNKMLENISRTLSNLKGRNQAMVVSKLNDLVKEIDLDLSKENEWTEFTGYFEQIHPQFFKNLNAAADEALSPSELRLAMLLRLNLSSKEIASILRITPDSVRIARYRMRKKLPLDSKQDLQAFLWEL